MGTEADLTIPGKLEGEVKLRETKIEISRQSLSSGTGNERTSGVIKTAQKLRYMSLTSLAIVCGDKTAEMCLENHQMLFTVSELVVKHC